MIEHPRPPPVDKKATSTLPGGLETGSPVPEGSYPPSDGTPAEAASESGAAAGLPGTAAARGSRRARGSARGRGTGPRRKPGPPKKNATLPPPIVGGSTDSAAVTPAPDPSNQINTSLDPSVASSATSNANTTNGAPIAKTEPLQEEAAVSEPKVEDTTTDSPAPIPA